MLACLILIPALAGLVSLFVRGNTLRRAILLAAASAHALLTARAWVDSPPPGLEDYLALDPLGLIFLSILSLLFLLSSVYATGYLNREQGSPQPDILEGTVFARSPEAIFTACLLEFLAAMTLVTLSQHFGLLWVAVEATTLFSAPLIFFHRNQRSLEATWKYLILCSVGIALALLGNFFLAVSAADPSGARTPLVLSALLEHAGHLHVQWLKAAFLLFLVGYGTKMGLAPLHSWLPDAHSESPSFVSMLLSGALLNCAFLGLLRVMQVCVAAGQAAFARELLVLFGFLSLVTAAMFILRQSEYKRLLAYSSVEHMGILILGVGLGGAGAYGALLHSINHSLTKGMLFLTAGNILAVYRSRSIDRVSGALRVIPVSGALWLAGLFAITGTPPFGLFLSEWTILRSAVERGQMWEAALLLALLGVIFAGMSARMLRMSQGEAPVLSGPATGSEPASSIVPPLVLGLLVLILGLWSPPVLTEMLTNASRLLGGY
ncbi:NADH dehydrogenase FAD-containing subunit [bacterium]|nr:NADH dehydrogenase FAD-containing subunit [bacterium]